MKNLTIQNILSACGGSWYGADSALTKEITAVTTDSRTISDGCLFGAIPGERVDGHDFVAAALKKGALCALVERIPEQAQGNLILVENTVRALQAIAAFYRSGFNIPVIGITGSVGKTTAKEMIASVLGQRFRVHKTAGNFNNDLGVPLTLFGLNESHEAAVVEMGVSMPGDMERLAQMVRPTMALYTIIGHAHLEALRSREGIFAEKTVMNRFLPENGTVFCAGDDDLLSAMDCPQEKISFGLSGHCTVRAEQAEVLPDGSTNCCIVRGDRRIPVQIKAYGDHMIHAALEGAAVGMKLGLTDAEISAGIAGYVPVGHRARRVTTEKLTVIDDCYNANPTSTAAALRSLSRTEGRRIAILGDMLELGENAPKLHYDTGVLAAECEIDLILAVGEQSAQTALGAGKYGRHFDSKEALIKALPDVLAKGDTVLVKASRSMRFEEITEALLNY